MKVCKATLLLYICTALLQSHTPESFVPSSRRGSYYSPWTRRFSAVEERIDKESFTTYDDDYKDGDDNNNNDLPKYVLDQDIVPDMSLLDAAQMTSSYPLAEMTQIFLNSQSHPKGTLSVDVLDSAFPVIYAWSKTNSPTGALVVEQILQRLEEEWHYGNKRVELTSKHYTVAIDAWARSKHYEAAPRAQELLNKMEALSLALESKALEPSRVSYNAVMNAWAKAGNVKKVEAVLERMQQNPNLEPNTNDYNVLLSTHARRGHARKAETVLGQMVQQCKQKQRLTDQHCECAPDLISYNCVLDAWSKSGEAGAAQRADDILQTLREQYERGESNIRPDAFSFANVANAWVRSGDPNAVEHAEAMLALSEAQGEPTDVYLYNAVLAGWAVSHMQGAAFKAQEVLDKMERDGVTNSVSYNLVIKAWKNSGEPDAAERAESILKRMEDLASLETDVEADVFTYTSVINCYANSRKQEAAKHAESLLEHMFELFKAGNTALKPNTVTINCVLDALAKSGDKDAADRAERLLTQMEESNEGYLEIVRPNTISYSTVIEAFSRSGKRDSAQRAEEIFQRMEKAHKGGNREAKPNIRSFNAVINAWVQSNDVYGVERAESILNQMEALYKEGNEYIRPTVVSYSIVMNGWSKSGVPDALQKVEDTFSKMVNMYESGNEDARPNMVSFVTLIDAIVKSGKEGAAHRAEDVLHLMFEQYKNGNADVRPNTKVMTTVMDCWSKSGSSRAAEKAEEWLNWIIEKSEKEDDDSLKPNELTFQVVINAWSKSRYPAKAARARAILDKMIQMYEDGRSPAKPNVFAYSAVLNSCAYPVGGNEDDNKQDPLQIATSTFNELCSNPQYGKPNHITYCTYLTVIRNLIPPSSARKSSMEAVFKKCAQDGQVDHLVMRRIVGNFDASELKEFIPAEAVTERGRVDLQKLPKEWRRNVRVARTNRDKKRRGRR